MTKIPWIVRHPAYAVIATIAFLILTVVCSILARYAAVYASMTIYGVLACYIAYTVTVISLILFFSFAISLFLVCIFLTADFD